METKKAKQAVTLALDTWGMRGRFTKRDVAEAAARDIKWESLCLSDQHDAMVAWLMLEARGQMKAPLRGEIKKELLANVPESVYPVLERLTKTICVSPAGGRGSLHVLSVYASEEDWDDFELLGATMERKAAAARRAAKNTKALLRKHRVGSLYELMSGKAVQRQAFLGRVAAE